MNEATTKTANKAEIRFLFINKNLNIWLYDYFITQKDIFEGSCIKLKGKLNLFFISNQIRLNKINNFRGI
jgi:hypothetical protein